MNVALSAISLFSGVGMLDDGLRAGLDYLGIAHRTLCHVEREAHAAAVLVARMEEGSVDAAPVWSDVTRFDARRWRGKVDCIVAGFPCQDLSVAGTRAGLDGQRSGLFFEVTRIAADCGAWLLFLENVAGIASATATVMDEAEGELEERAAARVVGELADLGWDAEWLHLSASAVGASHGRERWFCLAWRMADAARHGGYRSGDGEAGSRRREGRNELPRWARRSDSGGAGLSVANAGGARQQGGELRRTCDGDGGGQETYGPASEFRDPPLLFAPGPDDERWAAFLAEFPHLAPALEPAFRGVVNGLAFDMGDCRADRLKCAGNGVVALQAATAFVVLSRRTGIFS